MGFSEAGGEDCSVIVITRNEEASIRACLESVAFAAEIIVLDDESTDRTPEICRGFPQVRFITRKMDEGFGVQKARALALATRAWVFSIDADECVPPELRAEILGKIVAGHADGYRVARRNLVFGAWLDDRCPLMIRLFRREKSRFTLKRVDEAVIVDGVVEPLAGVLLHQSRSHRTVSAYYRVIVTERSRLVAADLFEMGRRVNGWNVFISLLARPSTIFLQKLLPKGGYRYGWRGWVLAFFAALAYGAGYAVLWKVQGDEDPVRRVLLGAHRPRPFRFSLAWFLRRCLVRLGGLDHAAVEGVVARWKILRQHRWTTLLLGPMFRPDHSRIEIEITTACDLKCFNCDRSCRQASSAERMTVAQIVRFVEESKAAGRRWRRIRVLGGEPTLHPELDAILAVLRDYKREFSPATVLVLTTNGAGAHVAGVLQRLPSDIVVENTRKSSAVNAFDTFNVAPADLPEYRHVDPVNACHIAAMCGMALTRYGYYACGAGAAIDRVAGYDIGRKALPNDGDAMKEQLAALCRLCGHFKHCTQTVDHEVMSSSWQTLYARYHTARPELTLFRDGA